MGLGNSFLKHLFLVVTLAILFNASVVLASQSYKAITTNNPSILVSDLEFVLVPLTKSELEIEAAAWTKLLRAKAVEVSKAEIKASNQQKAIDSAQEIADITKESTELVNKKAVDKNKEEQSKKELEEDIEEIKAISKEYSKVTGEKENKTEIKTDAASLESLSKKAEEYSKKTEQIRKSTVKNLTDLKLELNLLISRYLLVLDALDSKGGDSKEMRLYADVLSGVRIDIADSNQLWLAAEAWFVSKEGGVRWLGNLIKFVVFLAFIFLLASIVGRITDAAIAKNRNLSKLLKSFISLTVRRIVLGVGFLISLSFIEVDIGPVLAMIGAAGLVIGLALQGTLSNFASGMLILIYRPFDVGDFISIDGVSGVVDSMTLLSTSVKTLDNQLLIMPNNNVWGTTINNVTGSTTRRVDLVFGIGYGDDMDKAIGILEALIKEHDKILKKPEYMIKVHELGESSVNLICRPWVKTEDYWDVYWDLTKRVKEEFDKQGVSIPFPQRDVHLIKSDV